MNPQHTEWLDAMRWLLHGMPKFTDGKKYAGKVWHIDFSLRGEFWDNTEDDLRSRFFYTIPAPHRCPNRCGDHTANHSRSVLKHISAEAMEIWKATTGLPLIYKQGTKFHEHKPRPRKLQHKS